jgi:hypothetical protein
MIAKHLDSSDCRFEADSLNRIILKNTIRINQLINKRFQTSRNVIDDGKSSTRGLQKWC